MEIISKEEGKMVFRFENLIYKAVVVPQDKKCHKCKETKPFDQFAKDKYQPSGYSSKCKLCMAQASRDYEARKKLARQKLAQQQAEQPAELPMC